jgi:cell division protein FtsI/penicillin-binding protein 2
MSRAYHGRLRLLVGCIFFIAIMFVVRLYILQVMTHEALAAKATKQYVRTTPTTLERGTIYFTALDGTRSSAATLKTGGTIAINPSRLTDPEATYARLSSLVSIDRDDFFAKAKKKNDPYEEVAKRVEADIIEAIAEKELDGVIRSQDQWRLYPQGNLAANVLGFVGYKGNDQIGQYGLEEQYESVLSRSAKNVYKNFFAELFLQLAGDDEEGGEGHAGNIVTTIEPSVQAALEKELDAVKQTWNGGITAGIVMNPMNGEIVAMATRPSFDPNAYSKEKNLRVFSNPLVEDVYEMGSIIKPLTVAAGLDAGVITANTTYNDKGTLTLNNKTIYNYDKRGRGVVSMQEVLNQSLNTGVAFVVSKLGNARFADYLKKYGFESKTGIDLPNEGESLLKNLLSKRDIEYVTASYGQGIAMTPIATVRALAALGNGGVLVTPHVAKSIEYTSGVSKTISFPRGEQIISPESSAEISRMLTEVVDTSLLDGKYRQPHHTIAAKTGTALLTKPEGGYYDDRYLHSFFGYFPAKEPQFIVFLFTVDPQGVTYASHTLTDPFMNIAKYLITYYNIPPDR